MCLTTIIFNHRHYHYCHHRHHHHGHHHDDDNRSGSWSPAEAWLATDEFDPATSFLLSTMKVFGGWVSTLYQISFAAHPSPKIFRIQNSEQQYSKLRISHLHLRADSETGFQIPCIAKIAQPLILADRWFWWQKVHKRTPDTPIFVRVLRAAVPKTPAPSLLSLIAFQDIFEKISPLQVTSSQAKSVLRRADLISREIT